MFNIRSIFTKLTPTPGEKIPASSSSSSLLSEGRNTVEIMINNNEFVLENCQYIPRLFKNLICLLDLCNNPITISKKINRFTLSKGNENIMHGEIINKLMMAMLNQPSSYLILKHSNWNEGIGHPSNSILKSQGLLHNNDPCTVCVKAKSTMLPFKEHFEEVHHPLDCLHPDLVGPINPSSASGHKYFLTIMDQFTHSNSLVC
ncbi:hypothetical protein O181_077306 [Austropuccinia psidii MF-1]|uniref:Uncharacterized protein n=1 Tax=Austropuccinia psidii MF-1 TaxID=1389203 RepID=A0A9Q3FHT8_9BASI|nr:hypothetical protein [Austropuccinia psidii MF-1]